METEEDVIVLNSGQSGDRSIMFLNWLDVYVTNNEHTDVSQVSESPI